MTPTVLPTRPTHENIACGPLLRLIDVQDKKWLGSVLIVSSIEPNFSCDYVSHQEQIWSQGDVGFYRFTLVVPLKETGSEVSYVANGKTFVFHVPAVDEDMNTMFHSCNGFSLSLGDGAEYGGPDPLWKNVLKTHSQRPIHVMIGGGDQLYNDGVRVESQALANWLTLPTRHQKHTAEFTTQMNKEIDNYYLRHYAEWFSNGVFRQAVATIPMVNVWDDHDIIDGYGSYTDRTNRCSVFRNIGRLAHKYYMLFQHHSVQDNPNKGITTTEKSPRLRDKVHNLGDRHKEKPPANGISTSDEGPSNVRNEDEAAVLELNGNAAHVDKKISGALASSETAWQGSIGLANSSTTKTHMSTSDFSTEKPLNMEASKNSPIDPTTNGNSATDVDENRPWVFGAEGQYIEQRSRSVFVRFGPSLGLIGFDCRTERTKNMICSKYSYDTIFNRLEGELKAKPLSHLLVLLGVPIAYPRMVWLENLLSSRAIYPLKSLAQHGMLGGSLVQKFDGAIEVLDDLEDHWCAKHHKHERNAFVTRLQGLAARTATRLTILGGDVHLAAVGRFASHPAIEEPKDPKLMLNVISSAIVNQPPSSKLADFLNRRSKIHRLPGTKEDMMPLFDVDVDGSSRNNKRLLPRRNWCGISATNATNGITNGAASKNEVKSNLEIVLHVEIDSHDAERGTRDYPFSVPALHM